ncbi:response regulator [Aestuariibacter halophilus]|uniref:Response regulator n=1 Tax=Fluctibacter halophilus TaxID=226011 RepID=A0ABS8G615_9ALTE|nr:response regulator [Aestuariibacter halophilus]MCC2616037.1 response regulator [Aestuariibacter halophilus]
MGKILTVDDSVSMRSMVSFTLREQGHEVDEAENGQEGLDKASADHYDLVISDVNMPVMDGIELIKRLRANEKYRFTPILMLTTESGLDKKQEGKAAGATGWIVKPFDPAKLTAVVSKVLK